MKYSKQQSMVIALWVLAKGNVQGTAPSSITEIVNQLGDPHSSDSIFLHTHGYDRLLLGRSIDKAVTNLQREVADELKVQGIISTVYEC